MIIAALAMAEFAMTTHFARARPAGVRIAFRQQHPHAIHVRGDRHFAGEPVVRPGGLIAHWPPQRQQSRLLAVVKPCHFFLSFFAVFHLPPAWQQPPYFRPGKTVVDQVHHAMVGLGANHASGRLHHFLQTRI